MLRRSPRAPLRQRALPQFVDLLRPRPGSPRRSTLAPQSLERPQRALRERVDPVERTFRIEMETEHRACGARAATCCIPSLFGCRVDVGRDLLAHRCVVVDDPSRKTLDRHVRRVPRAHHGAHDRALSTGGASARGAADEEPGALVARRVGAQRAGKGQLPLEVRTPTRTRSVALTRARRRQRQRGHLFLWRDGEHVSPLPTPSERVENEEAEKAWRVCRSARGAISPAARRRALRAPRGRPAPGYV